MAIGVRDAVRGFSVRGLGPRAAIEVLKAEIHKACSLLLINIVWAPKAIRGASPYEQRDVVSKTDSMGPSVASVILSTVRVV